LVCSITETVMLNVSQLQYYHCSRDHECQVGTNKGKFILIMFTMFFRITSVTFQIYYNCLYSLIYFHTLLLCRLTSHITVL
jgi:hypothetical protein